MESILEILKYTVPALVVFITVYYLFNNFFRHQYALEALKLRESQGKHTFPLKLQAYERILMMCERMSPENLFYRLSNAEFGVKELKNAMLLAVQQEYDHNLSQQLYISDRLWEIVQLSKDQILDIISMGQGSSQAELLTNIHAYMLDNRLDPIRVAKKAIKDEAQLLFNP